MRFALAIYVYTLDDPMIYSVINRVMFDPARGVKGAAHGNDLSPGLLACAPYIKLLDEALARLPAAFVFRGRVQRGVKWVYPRPDAHDPERHFAPGMQRPSPSNRHAPIIRTPPDRGCEPPSGLRAPSSRGELNACRALHLRAANLADVVQCTCPAASGRASRMRLSILYGRRPGGPGPALYRISVRKR